MLNGCDNGVIYWDTNTQKYSNMFSQGASQRFKAYMNVRKKSRCRPWVDNTDKFFPTSPSEFPKHLTNHAKWKSETNMISTSRPICPGVLIVNT